MMCGVATIIFHFGSRSNKPMSNQIIGLLLLLLLLTACKVPMNTSPSGATVTLSTFSGRTNPTWNLEEKQLAVLRQIVASLQPTDKPLDVMGLPPYAGFRVGGGNVVASASYLEIYDGIVAVLDSSYDELERLADPEYRIETYLFETGKAHLDPQIYQEAVDRFHKLIR